MRINQNVMAFNASRNLSGTNVQLGKSLEKLSSGFRINRAADDAAGLVISQGLRAQISGLKQATRNAQDGISVVQTAEGALTEVHTMLNRMRDLAVQAANTGSSDVAARQAAQEELSQLGSEIDRISSSTKFGSQNLLDGTFGLTNQATGTAGVFTPAGADVAAVLEVDGQTINVTVLQADAQTAESFRDHFNEAVQTALSANGAVSGESVRLDYSVDTDGVTFTLSSSTDVTVTSGLAGQAGIADLAVTASVGGSTGVFQVGANAGETIDVRIGGMSAATLGINNADLIGDPSSAITAIDGAIAAVSTTRGELGAVQNRFESTINNLSVTTENLSASESRIRDTDMAAEMVSFTRNQVLQQAGTAMLAQANQVPQTILSLLR